MRTFLTARSLRGWLACAVLAGLLLAADRPAGAQVLRGEWVEASEKAIDQHRKTDIQVIVLDRDDRALQGVTVQVDQLRHDFVLGLAVPTDQAPPKDFAEKPVYRCFNAIALDRFTDWSARENRTQSPAAQVLKQWAEAIRPVEKSFGRVVSADPALNADELSMLGPGEMQDALMARIDYATALTPRPDRYDLYGDLLHQDVIARKLGHGMVHRMFERARAKRPDATLALRVRDGISLQRGRELVNTALRLQARQVPVDAVTIEQRFGGQLNPIALQRMMNNTITRLDLPVSLAGVEVGGPSPAAAAMNLEAVLRLAFAQPGIEGVYLAGLTDEALVEPDAALIDDAGEPTPAGLAFDGLFRGLWWTDLSATTDERGNAQARVFTGWHNVKATLPNGRVIAVEVYVPRAERAKIIVLQATAVEQPDPR